MKKVTTAMKKKPSNSKAQKKDVSPARTETKNNAPGDWRLAMLAKLRAIVQRADSELVEEVKWKKPSNPAGVPVWSRDGIVCTGETYKSVVKMTFAKGASLPDPTGLFNSSLEGNTRRAIDFHEGDKVDEKALTDLVRAAVAVNIGAVNIGARNKSPRATVRPARSPKKPKRG